MNLALTFDDVALVPQFNNVLSRDLPSLETWITKDYKAKIPYIPANMDTVISPDLAWEMDEFGGMWIIHRFTKDLKTELKKYPPSACISWGVRPETTDDLIKVIHDIIDDIKLWGVCIDVAHAHSIMALNMITTIKSNFSNLQIIAGNVCTARGYRDLVNAGADAVKVGVGCGAACTTRVVTGFGVPQFTAIQECAAEAIRMRIPIIADGGIRNSRDIVLALAAGASSVMMGKMFAACIESAAEKRDHLPGHILGTNPNLLWVEAKYRGQASFDFQQEFYGEVKHAPEGEAIWIKTTGLVKDLLESLNQQVKVGMTYGGATSIKELQRKAEFVRVTPTYQQESGIRP